MKSLVFSVIFSCLIIVFNACDPAKRTGAPSAGPAGTDTSVITGKRWKLIELNGKPVADRVNGKEPYLRLGIADSSYTASGGCNGIGGTFSLSGNGRIKFSQGRSTMMACENMEVENGLNKALPAVDNYTVAGDILSLSKAQAPLARFRAVDDPAAGHGLNGTWEADYVSEATGTFEELYPGKKPVLTFDLPEPKATGHSSCNGFMIPFTLDGHNISFDDPVSTLMACPGDGEGAFFHTLKTVTRYGITGDTLRLIKDDIAVMRLHRK